MGVKGKSKTFCLLVSKNESNYNCFIGVAKLVLLWSSD